jgi:hypothetical protein
MTLEFRAQYVSKRTVFETITSYTGLAVNKRLPLSIKTHIKIKASILDKFNEF